VHGVPPEGLSKDSTAAGNRRGKRAHVDDPARCTRSWSTTATSAWAGASTARPPRVATIKNAKAYQKELTGPARLADRVRVPDSRHRGEGVSRAAVTAALDAIGKAGGGVVEAYPEQVEGREPQRGAYLHNRCGRPVRGARVRPRPQDREVALGDADDDDGRGDGVAQVSRSSRNLTVRAIAASNAGPKAWPSSYHCSWASTPAFRSARRVAGAQRGGQVSSTRPCTISTGSVIRATYGREEFSRQKRGFCPGAPWRRASWSRRPASSGSAG